LIAAVNNDLTIIFSFFICDTGSVSRLQNPIIPFMGVRISWLILERKADLSLSLSLALTSAEDSCLFFASRMPAILFNKMNNVVTRVVVNISNVEFANNFVYKTVLLKVVFNPTR